MPNFILSNARKQSSLRVLDARADDTDAKDYIFNPSLAQLPPSVDHSGPAPILDQGNEGACVGFALATVVNLSLHRQYTTLPLRERPRKKSWPVSHRMLYEMARRYDEWHGENYEGTSLRGAMKGWYKHGVASEAVWPYMKNGWRRKPIPEREFTPERAQDALRRPVGAYYRIVDSDVSHVQAAIIEGDAVLASAWVHPGWEQGNLQRLRGNGWALIPPQTGKQGLHAFAIVGYNADGFIIHNSWGKSWGSHGLAILPYEDWFENRQDAWVARPGPETHNVRGEPQIFGNGFGGGAPSKESPAETSVSGFDLDSRFLPRLINTDDRGRLSSHDRLHTRPEELPAMAREVLGSKILRDGYHHVVLYAHGGLNAEEDSARNAERLWRACEERDLHAYFFIWESGLKESVVGWLRSDDDVTGPARFSWSDAWENIKQGAGKKVREVQRNLGAGLAEIVREVFWDEMKGRARGASTPLGGGALFGQELLKAMAATPREKYKIHLVGHSAGSIYLAWLYQSFLKEALNGGNVRLASIQFMAPAITVRHAREAFGNHAVKKENFIVYTLKPDHEEKDNIVIYPSSLLTYVADHLESNRGRVPLLGIRKDFDAHVDFARALTATKSVRHGQFDDKGKEVERILDQLADAKF